MYYNLTFFHTIILDGFMDSLLKINFKNIKTSNLGITSFVEVSSHAFENSR